MIVIPPFRGIQLGRPELMKTWEKFEHKKSAKAEKGKSSVDSELESRFRSISQKQEVRRGWSIYPLYSFSTLLQSFLHRIHAFLLVNSPYSNISMYILHTVLYTFSMVLMKRIWRICLIIKSCFCW